MDSKGLRNAARRLVVELVALVLLVGFGTAFPRHTSAGRAWSFLVQHPVVLLHVLVGTLILVEATVLLIGSIRSRHRRTWMLAGAGVVFAVLAYGSGIAYVSLGQRDSALTFKTVGWLGAITTYAIGWWQGHRARTAGAGATNA